jgi:hypothetical protein
LYSHERSLTAKDAEVFADERKGFSFCEPLRMPSRPLH